MCQDAKKLRPSEKLAFEWLVVQNPQDKVCRNPKDPPDFILESEGGKRVYAEVTECGRIDRHGNDKRRDQRTFEKIIKDEIKNARETLGLFSDTAISVTVLWPCESIPTDRKSETRRLISKQVRVYGKCLESYRNNDPDSYKMVKLTIPLEQEESPAELCFYKRRCIETADTVAVNIGKVGSQESERYIYTVKKALRNKTKQKVKDREGGYSEYWLVFVDKSSLLIGDEHKSPLDWKRVDWDIAKDEISKDSDATYWDKIVLVSNVNDYLDHLDIFRRDEDTGTS